MSALTPFRSLTRSNRSIAGSRNGVALLVVLAFVILLSILVTSFLSFSGLDRLSTASYSKSIQAQEIAQGGLQDIIADLHQEIVAGSIPDPGGVYTQGTAPNTTTIYVPSTNITASPPRLGYAASTWAFGPTAAPAAAPATLLPTLVQVSRGDPNGANAFQPALTAPVYSNLGALPNGGNFNRASLASTGTSSVNGRYISAERWNKPYLLASRTGLLPTPFYGGEALPTTAYPGTPDLPDWVYTMRTGSLACTTASLPNMIPSKNPSTAYAAGTTSPVVGRYAYVIYDEGALLDANVAGSPTSLVNTSTVVSPPPLYTNSPSATPPTPTSLAYNGKSYTSFADLMQLYGFSGGSTTAQTTIDNFVKFRNAAGIANANASYGNGIAGSTYLGALFGYAQNGFLNFQSNTTVPTSDSPLLNRQDLINYFTKIDSSINTSSATYSQALPYLGTFSRAVSAPSYSPPLDSQNIPGYPVAGDASYSAIIAATTQVEYKDKAEDLSVPGTTNRDLANVRYNSPGMVTHYYDNQSSATPTAQYAVKVGDPLLQGRFSLAKISWLSDQSIGGSDPNGTNPVTGHGPSATYATAIKACFGLVWDFPGGNSGTTANGGNKCWNYTGPTGTPTSPASSIETLAQVAAESPPREPNFFELLKAAILSGSVGLNPGPAAFDNGKFDLNPPSADMADNQGGYKQLNQGAFNYYISTMDGHAISQPTVVPARAQVGDMQILQIGANIIDQYDADSYPTAIYLRYTAINSTNYDAGSSSYTGAFGPTDIVYGDENLPELQALENPVCSPDGSAPVNPSKGSLESWWQPELWNPHQQPNAVNPVAPPPPKFIIAGYGASQLVESSGSNSPSTPLDGQTISFTVSQPLVAFCSAPQILIQTPIPGVTSITPNVAAGSAAATIGLIATSDMSANSSMNGYNKNPFVGFSMGIDTNFVPAAPPKANNFYAYGKPVATFCLGWSSNGTDFHPYSYFTGIFASTYGKDQYASSSGGVDTAGSCDLNGVTANYCMVIDPRTSHLPAYASFGVSYNTDIYPDSNSYDYGLNEAGWGYSIPGNFVYPMVSNPNGSGYAQEDWEVNQKDPISSTSASATLYADPDGVVRPGDGQYRNPNTGDGTFLFLSNGTPNAPSPLGDSGGNTQHGRRPAVLNRPFRSVGELGYVFRDLPIKTLDFFSTSSADAALLDVFSLTDESKVGDSQLGSVIAGQVNLSNAPLPVLEAILSGGSKKDLDPTWNFGNEGGTSPVPLVKIATAMATSMNPSSISATNPGPLMSRASLVTQLSQSVSKPSGTTGTVSQTTNFQFGAHDTGDKANKAYLEGPLRAMASVTNTRTWNLMIDIIAQSGQMTPTATKLDNFVVQGERRYWLHLAIDRYTGKVVAQQLEPVYE